MKRLPLESKFILGLVLFTIAMFSPLLCLPKVVHPENTPFSYETISSKAFRHVNSLDGPSHPTCSFEIFIPSGKVVRYQHEGLGGEMAFLKKCYLLSNGDKVLVWMAPGSIKKFYWQLPSGETIQLI